ncbi:phenylacetate--CoA ligase family protein [Paracoccus sp. Z330]|uniref:Phenylacetate--CoA ligase family protein n=1 Tax=Paracoccus onchidii TaxID=3017813 RepID=A0ABT4ZHS8_9RHOB|nr:phenylacetate--CoA ligase family protein [Paracoccus onchidii]MDB6178804.1 phenylacetate--CoA ligase family protein [Paracoccus onchidii]
MTGYFDELETRSDDARQEALGQDLPLALARAKTAPALARLLREVDPASVTDRSALARLPVIRKAELTEAQAKTPPFGGYATRPAAEFDHIFQSPGPIYEPGRREGDWWRLGRFLHASGVGRGDIVQNCFGYHLTPAGMMFESGARAVDAAVLPAGTGQTELQVRAAVDIGTTCYAGTPDFLKVILDRADAMGESLGIIRAVVGGGALFPSLRQEYGDRGIVTRQCYATADLGNIAYESEALEGMIVDEGVIVEIVRPGTGDPVPDGEVGEVVVTTLNPDYPLVRFATGDLSAVLPGPSPCGRTNMRIRGWMGRADQTTKIKGMFVRPEQVAALVARHPEIGRARVVAERDGEMDVMTVQLEAPGGEAGNYAASVMDTLKLKARIQVVAPGSLPNDGKVIEDRRSYD